MADASNHGRSSKAQADETKPPLPELFPCFPSLYKRAPGWLADPAAIARATGVSEARVREAAEGVLAKNRSIARLNYLKSLYDEPGRSTQMTVQQHQSVWREAGLIVSDSHVRHIPSHATLTIDEMADVATPHMTLDPDWIAPAGFDGDLRDCNGPDCSQKCRSECVCGWAFCSPRCHVDGWCDHEQFCFAAQQAAYLATQLTEAYWAARPRAETEWSDSDEDYD
jgi:hypothetical protein